VDCKTLGSFGQPLKVNATLNAWAIINNLRTFLPDAKHAGKSLVEVFGVQLQNPLDGSLLNLCTVGAIVGFRSSIGVSSVSSRHQFLIYVSVPTSPAAPLRLLVHFARLPDAEPEELWEPQGASYNSELILQPKQRWTTEEQLWLLDHHPMFTGRCRACERPFPRYEAAGAWDCPCGWMDDSV